MNCKNSYVKAEDNTACHMSSDVDPLLVARKFMKTRCKKKIEQLQNQ